MRFPLMTVAAAAATTVLLGTSVVGCSSKSPTTSSGSATSSASRSATSSSGAAAPADYTGLLIKETDITAPGDTFTAQPPTQNPNGQPGVVTGFTNRDGTCVIGDTILVLPDAAAAENSLAAAKGTVGDAVTGADRQPVAVGTGGYMASGPSPDGSKAVTVLLFAEGKAFTTLEFDSPPTIRCRPNSSPTSARNKTPQSGTACPANPTAPYRGCMSTAVTRIASGSHRADAALIQRRVANRVQDDAVAAGLQPADDLVDVPGP